MDKDESKSARTRCLSGESAKRERDPRSYEEEAHAPSTTTNNSDDGALCESSNGPQ